MSKISSYDKAYKELQEIIAAVQSEEIGIDQLSAKVERAKELILFCKAKLRDTEAVLKSLED